MANRKDLGEGFHLVRTQAGFKSLCKEVENREPGDPPMEVEGYPESYPAVVTIGFAYRGYHYLEVTSIHVNKLMTGLKGV